MGRGEWSPGHWAPWLCSPQTRGGSVQLVSPPPPPPSLSRLGLILLLVQYSTDLLFHTARLFYFADENNEKL